MPAFLPPPYIDEPIEALFDKPPALEKKPGCPNGFVWRGETQRIIEMLSEWHDYERRGGGGKKKCAPHPRRGGRHTRLVGRGPRLVPRAHCRRPHLRPLLRPRAERLRPAQR